MNEIRAKLIYFLDKYGLDFFHKLPKYKTASYKGKYVKLVAYSSDFMKYLIQRQGEKELIYVDVLKLDDFCL